MTSKGVSIIGSTGSIGCNTLRVIESLGPEQFRVVAIGAGQNVTALADQVARHLPVLVSVESDAAAHALRALLFERNIDLPRIVIGEEGLIEVATHAEAECVVSATVGAVGFVPTLRLYSLQFLSLEWATCSPYWELLIHLQECIHCICSGFQSTFRFSSKCST